MSVEEQKFTALVDRLSENIDKLAETSNERYVGTVDGVIRSIAELRVTVTDLKRIVVGNGTPGMDEVVRSLDDERKKRGGYVMTAKNAVITCVISGLIGGTLVGYISSKVNPTQTPVAATQVNSQPTVDAEVKKKLKEDVLKDLREEYIITPKSDSVVGRGRTGKSRVRVPEPPQSPEPVIPGHSIFRDKGYHITRSTIPDFYFSMIVPEEKEK